MPPPATPSLSAFSPRGVEEMGAAVGELETAESTATLSSPPHVGGDGGPAVGGTPAGQSKGRKPSGAVHKPVYDSKSSDITKGTQGASLLLQRLKAKAQTVHSTEPLLSTNHSQSSESSLSSSEDHPPLSGVASVASKYFDTDRANTATAAAASLSAMAASLNAATDVTARMALAYAQTTTTGQATSPLSLGSFDNWPQALLLRAKFLKQTQLTY
jgi:hypothetical protein